MIGRRDDRLQAAKTANSKTEPAKKAGSGKSDDAAAVRYIPQVASNLFFEANEALVPPYRVILDTNFFSHTVRNKLDPLNSLMDLLLAKCTPVVTDCVMAELEKLGDRYRLALRVAKDERWQRLSCSHSGTYADDCIVSTVVQHRIYLVGTNDKQLRQRLRRIPGVPLVAVGRGKYTVERLPGATV